jgi:large subunit ribosomal protein L25
MSEITLNCSPREHTGTQNVKRLRREGKIPGIYYFHGQQSIPFQLEKKEFTNLKSHESGLITVILNGEQKKCVIREIQFDPISHFPLHIDLMGISMTEKIHVTVPIHFVGTPVGVKNGGILQQVVRDLEIECFPSDLPEHIEVDVSHLDIGHSIAVREIQAEKFKILVDENITLANVAMPRAVEEKVPEEAAVEEVKEPELVGKKEKEEAKGEEEA